MKMVYLWLVLMMFGMTAGELPPPERTYKIMMLLPVSSRSHRNVFLPLANALAERGHQIVILSNNNKPSKNPNIKELHHQLPYIEEDNYNVFERRKQPDGVFSFFRDILPRAARDLYHQPQIKELYARRKDFDLIVIDHMFNELVYPFAHEMPFMTVATPGMDPRQSSMLGNPLSPAYVPSFVNPKDTADVCGRILNTFMHILFPFYWSIWAILPLVQTEISIHFPDLPPLHEIERNQSLVLLNSHFSMDLTVPLLPSQVEVGGMHCRPAEPLSDDILSWINGAGPAGVIYFSLGSVARGDTMPVQYRDMFIEAFSKLEQRILWKFEANLEGVPKNVMIRKWLPQQDVLGNTNVKVFITHGGLLSLQESAYHGTPLLALPIFGDQPKNGDKIVANGFGLSLIWEELTVDIIVKSLQEIINIPKYGENVAAVSNLMKDQLNSPLERAVFWTEFVTRHKGAPKLRSPAADLSWVELLLLDVIAILLLIIIVILLLSRWIIKKILCCVFGKNNKKMKKKKE